MVELRGLVLEPPRAMLVFEYAGQGTLLTMLETEGPQLDFLRRMELAVDVASAMEFVASKGVLHKDLRA